MNFAVYYTEACGFLGERSQAVLQSLSDYPYGQQNKAGPENAPKQSKSRHGRLLQAEGRFPAQKHTISIAFLRAF